MCFKHLKYKGYQQLNGTVLRVNFLIILIIVDLYHMSHIVKRFYANASILQEKKYFDSVSLL